MRLAMRLQDQRSYLSSLVPFRPGCGGGGGITVLVVGSNFCRRAGSYVLGFDQAIPGFLSVLPPQ